MGSIQVLIAMALYATSVRSRSTVLLDMARLNECLNSSIATIMAQFDTDGLLYIYNTNITVNVLDIPDYRLADCVDEQGGNPHVSYLELPAIDIDLVGSPVPVASMHGIYTISTTGSLM